MSASVVADSQATKAARWLNLLAPGAGLVLAGHVVAGCVVGLVFATAANFAIVGGLIMPDEVSPTWVGLAIGVTGGAYAGAQIRLTQSLREDRMRRRDDERRRVLAEVRAALEAGDAQAALRAIAPIRGLASDDLLIAYRLAQVLTASGDADAAAAWEHLRRLDRHRIYADVIRRHLGDAVL